MTKIQFWKQFTTSFWRWWLFGGCIQYDKDTILKAIYNRSPFFYLVARLYSVWQRYNFESNLQLRRDPSFYLLCCIQYDKDTILKAIYNSLPKSILLSMLYSVWQRYNFESNLQLLAVAVVNPHSCIQYDKDTILKAIYNLLVVTGIGAAAVFSMTKIQFWKQFTTYKRGRWGDRLLYSVWQRYNFESNLQYFNFQIVHYILV